MLQSALLWDMDWHLKWWDKPIATFWSEVLYLNTRLMIDVNISFKFSSCFFGFGNYLLPDCITNVQIIAFVPTRLQNFTIANPRINHFLHTAIFILSNWRRCHFPFVSKIKFRNVLIIILLFESDINRSYIFL